MCGLTIGIIMWIIGGIYGAEIFGQLVTLAFMFILAWSVMRNFLAGAVGIANGTNVVILWLLFVILGVFVGVFVACLGYFTLIIILVKHLLNRG
jgi:hypothetical protein